MSIGNASESTRLQQVTEVPVFPKNAITNNYRKQRLLAKGSPKLIKMVEKHKAEIDKSMLRHNRLSSKLASQITAQDRVKMSIMSTRSNALDSPLRNGDDRTFSGF